MADEPNDHLLILTFKGEIAKVLVPNDNDTHSVLLATGPNGEDIYLDNWPVDPDTGEVIRHEPTSELLSVCDEMVQFWENSGWKLSTNTKKIQKSVDRYKKLRAEVEAYGEALPSLDPPESSNDGQVEPVRPGDGE